MKTDQQFAQEVDFLVHSLLISQGDVDAAHFAFIEAGEAFLAEAQRDSNSRRLHALRQNFERASLRAKAFFQTQLKNLNAMRDLLRAWRSPGRDVAQYAEDCRRIHADYVNILNQLAAEVSRTLSLVAGFDATVR